MKLEKLERDLMLSDLYEIYGEIADEEGGDTYRAMRLLDDFIRKFEEITK